MIEKHNALIRAVFWATMLIVVVIFGSKLETEETEEIEPHTANSVVSIQPTIVKEISVVCGAEFESEKEPKYGFSDDEIYLLTVLLCGSKYIDGDGEYDIDFGLQDNLSQVYLPLNIVMNRVQADGFPDTVADVIWQPRQFISEMRNPNNLPEVSEDSYNIVKKWCEMYDTHNSAAMVIPENHFFYDGNGRINKSRQEWR